jgi:hypothetical protein
VTPVSGFQPFADEKLTDCECGGSLFDDGVKNFSIRGENKLITDVFFATLSEVLHGFS